MRRGRDVVGLLIVSALLFALATVLYAAASYPSSVKTFSTRSNGQTISASWFNDLQDEVHAVEDALLNGFAHKLIPSTDGGQDLGSSLKHWNVAYLNSINGFASRGGCDLRLTLTSATPVTTTDVTGAVTVYATPYSHEGGGPSYCAFYDGSTTWSTIAVTEVSISLGTLSSGKPYDIFCFNNAGAMNCDSPLAWTNDTTRATALTRQDGVYVKTGVTTRRYLGTFYTTSTTQTEDSAANRYVWSYYNRLPRTLRAVEATNTWTYTTNTYQQANASTANQVGVMVGLAESVLDLMAVAKFSNTGPNPAWTAIGEDSTTTPATGILMAPGFQVSNGQPMTNLAWLKSYPAVGRHVYAWLEKSTAAGTTTWYGDNNAPTQEQFGLTGTIH